MEDANFQRKEAFVTEYNEIVKKHGVQLAALPFFKLRDDGTYSIIIRYDVDIMPEQPKEEKKPGGLDKK
jgi:hypothetical protein